MEPQQSGVSGQPVPVRSSKKRKNSISGGELESEEEIRNFIEKLKKVDVLFYVFRRDNYLKCPYPCRIPFARPFRDEFVQYENMENPVEGIDLGNVKHFSHDRMVEITSDFSEKHYIRKAVLGRLFRGGIVEGSGMPPWEVIVKRWDFFFPIVAIYDSYPTFFTRQLELLLNPHVASHPKMAKLMGFCCDKIFALVFDLNLNLTVHDLIPCDSFTWSPRMKVARQVADTLKFFHGRQIALCNFSSPSISVDEDYNIQLFEFDRAVDLANENFPVAQGILGGTYMYYSPESMLCGAEFQREWFFTSDVYAFGLLLLELTLAKCVEEEPAVLFVEWAKQAFAKGETYSRFNITLCLPQMMIFDLAMKCVQEDPKMRPNMDEIVVELDKLSQFETEG